MALARVVTFEGVSKERAEQMKGEMESGEQPEGLNATEVIILHDGNSEESIAIVFFDNEEDYASGDAILDAMPADDTPGRRTGVRKYDVPIRMTM